MNVNFVHNAYYDHIKHDRNVVFVTETQQIRDYYIREILDHYIYALANRNTKCISFKNQCSMRFTTIQCNPHMINAMSENSIVLVDSIDLNRIAKMKYNELVSLAKHINERTLGHGH